MQQNEKELVCAAHRQERRKKIKKFLQVVETTAGLALTAGLVWVIIWLALIFIPVN